MEVLVTSALIALVFGGLFAGLRLMIELVGHSKAEAGARALAVSKLEYIRSLNYEDVGTVGGIPAGPVPQTGTTTLNGIDYEERVLVQYLDRPEDGFGGEDENGITADSKIVKVEYSWELRGEEKSFSLVSDVIPPGIESTAGGGTLFIHVFDENAQPVEGADVHVVNTTGTSTIDVTVRTNAQGNANFPGAPALSGYEVSATKGGFSTDRTYDATATNTNPQPPHVSVIEGAVSTVNFAIDELADLTVRAFWRPVSGEFADTFGDSAKLYQMTDTAVAGGALRLAGSAGAYASSGSAFSNAVSPAAVDAWDFVAFSGTTTVASSYRIRVYEVTESGTTTAYALLPDSALAGNGVGFTAGPIDLSSIDPASYPSLALGAEFVTSDPSSTAELIDWSIAYIEERDPAEGVTIELTGAKTIGTHNDAPVPKYEGTRTTDGAGEAVFADMESDTYAITIDEEYDIIEAQSPLPYVLQPGASAALTLILDTHTANSLRVSVRDGNGDPVGGAEVILGNSSYEETVVASTYGEAYFGAMPAGEDYMLVVNAEGYEQYSDSPITVNGTGAATVELIAQ